MAGKGHPVTVRRLLSALFAALSAVALVGVVDAAHAVAAPGFDAAGRLPAGYLSTVGNQLVPQGHKAPDLRISAVGWAHDEIAPFSTRAQNVAAMRRAGFNTITIGWYDSELRGTAAATFWQEMDSVVTTAAAYGMKVIFNHHGDEGLAGTINFCLSQQANGLWYDSGPGTDGTDGCGDPGTVTQQVFLSDWEQIAHRYAGNPTVIGFDLDNEPLAYPGMSTWGDGSPTDIRAMYSQVGSALEAIDPGVLIIAEGPQNYGGNLANIPGVTTPEGDLSAVATDPVTLIVHGHQVNNKVVYSIHEYPNEISGVDPDNGPDAVARFNGAWGSVVKSDIAPVWIGEAGSSMQNNPDDAAWAKTLTDYVNGQDGAQGGPTFAPNQQGISTTWWRWGYRPGEYPDGTLNSDGTLKSDQFAVYCQWQSTHAPGCRH